MLDRTKLGVLQQRGLKKVIYEAYVLAESELSNIFNMNTSDGAYEEWTAATGLLGLAQEKVEGQPLTYIDPAVLTPKRIPMTTFGIGLVETLEARGDNRYPALKNAAAMLGEACAERREIDGANVLNLGFTTALTTGHDGLALFSTSHPLLAGRYAPSDTNLSALPVKTTLTASNRLATDSDISYTTLQDAITLGRRTVNEQGNYITMGNFDALVIPPELAWIVDEIKMSPENPITANRAANIVRGYINRVIVWNKMLDTDAWFCKWNRHDLQWFERMKLEVRSMDANDGTWNTNHEAVMRYGRGHHDWRGWIGTPGQ